MAIPTDLRSRQAELARQSIIEALVQHLKAGDVDDVAMEDLAREAGLSRRTVYRYFKTRDELFAAAGEAIADRIGFPIEVSDVGIVQSFREASTALAREPQLARALLRTSTGRGVRSGYRAARVEAIRRAVEEATGDRATQAMVGAAGVIAYLASSNAWVTVQDESAITAEEAQVAVAWGIETLLADLKRRARRIRSES
ncbi:MAG: TetR/AcrR family transcriptional regulator [Candidatus Dormibacteraeota bacterium]|nr:TetR/AcrR family transcriptional regulator [Candidatus Dormibacteraeota bacterium]